LYDTSLLTSGFTLSQPGKYANRIHKLISLGLNLYEEEQSNIEEEQHQSVEQLTLEEID